MHNQKNILTTLADNPALMDAVKALIMKHADGVPVMGPDTNDIVLGQFLRARMTTLTTIDDAWRELAQYKSSTPQAPRENPAR